MNRTTINPDQCGGKPCIRDLRIRVEDVLEMMAEGTKPDEILADFQIGGARYGRPVAGWEACDTADLEVCATTARRRAAPLSSLTGLGSWVAPAPSVETLGYARTALRDWAATASGAHFQNCCQILLARHRNFLAASGVSRNLQFDFGRWLLACVSVQPSPPHIQ